MPNSANAPEWVKESLTAYVQTGRPTGDFLGACLANDFRDAIGRADENSMAAIADIAAFIYNKMPSACHGSREAVQRWQAQGGWEGVYGGEWVP